MKKFLLALLTALLGVCCMFAACGTSNGEQGGGNGGDEPEVPPIVEPTKSLAFALESDTVAMFGEKRLEIVYDNILGAITFTSSDESVATVDNDGLVKGVKRGTSVITVACDGLTDTLQLEVTDYDHEKLQLFCEFDTLNLYEGYVRDLAPVVLYGDKIIEGGEFTYSLTDGETVSVSGNEVTALKKGVSVVTINGTIRGETLAPVTVNINVIEKAEVILDSYSQNIYISAGSQGQNFATEFDVAVQVRLNDKDVENPEFTVSYSEEDVAVYEDGKVKAVNLGSTVITFTYTTKNDTVATAKLSVTVNKPVANLTLDTAEFIKNRAQTFNFDFTDEAFNFNGVKEIAFDGEVLGETAYSFENGTLKVDKSIIKNDMTEDGLKTTHSFTVYAENDKESFEFSQEVNVIDFALGTKKELDEFFVYMRANSQIDTAAKMASERLYVILDNDIDFENSAGFYTRGTGNLLGYFTGIFDGQGHTIANINMDWHAPFWGLATATVKNVAFVNITKTHNSVGSLLFWNNYGTNTIENFYVKGSVAGNVAQTNLNGFGNSLSNFTVRNAVINIEFPQAGVGNITANSGSVAGLKYVYGISATANAFHGEAELPVDCAFYSSVLDFRADSADIFENFDEKYWDVEAGTLMFTSAKKFLPVYTEIAISSASAVESEGNSYVMAGEHVVTTLPSGATLALANAVEGVTFTDNTLTIADTVSAGTTITLNATYVDPVYGNEITGSKTFTVVSANTINVEGTYLLAKNRGTVISGNDTSRVFSGEDLDLDLSSYVTFTQSELSNATYNDKNVTANVTVSDNKVKVNAKALDSGIHTLSLVIMKDGSTYTVNVTLRVVDYAIGNGSELKYFQFNACRTNGISGATNTTAETPYVYAVVTASFDATVNGLNSAGFATNAYFSGELDGQGYTIDKMSTGQAALFWGIKGATFKNIAFTNVTSTRNSAGGIFAWNSLGVCTFSNVYVQGVMAEQTNKTTAGFIYGGNGNNIVLNNVVVDIEYSKTIDMTINAIYVEKGPYTGSDFIVISKTIKALLGGNTTISTIENSGLYTDVAAVKAAELDLSGFDSAYWNTESGAPVFKTK